MRGIVRDLVVGGLVVVGRFVMVKVVGCSGVGDCFRLLQICRALCYGMEDMVPCREVSIDLESSGYGWIGYVWN